MTHEEYIQAVADLAIARLTDPQAQEALRAIKLTYGAGPDGTRGVTYYNRWNGNGSNEARPFVAINALHQEDWTQLAGTTIHELGHVLAGWNAGHDKPWKEACAMLGLRRIKAAGTCYRRAMFAPDLRDAIARLPLPHDGKPVPFAGLPIFGGLIPGSATLKPCGAGRGTKGGKSYSANRYRRWSCECDPPQIVRAATDHLRAHCDCCAAPFSRR